MGVIAMDWQTFLEKIDDTHVVIDTKSTVLDRLVVEKMKQDKTFRDDVVFISSSLFGKKVVKIFDNQNGSYLNAIVINSRAVLDKYWPIILVKRFYNDYNTSSCAHTIEAVVGDWRNLDYFKIMQNIYKHSDIVFSKSFERKYREQFFQEKNPVESRDVFIEMLKEFKRLQETFGSEFQYDLLSPARLCYRHDTTYTTINVVFESLLNPVGEKEIRKLVKDYDYKMYTILEGEGVDILKHYKLLNGWECNEDLIMTTDLFRLLESYRNDKNTICVNLKI